MTAVVLKKPPADGAEPVSDGTPRVLIVDDEPSLREMLRIVLGRDGYRVTVAASGREAVDVIGRSPFDLLISDIRMGDVGGVDVLRAAKAANRDMVVFMMTAFASTDTAVEAMRLGAVDYFTKPFNMDELRLKVRQHLESSRLKLENVLLKRALQSRSQFSNIIGRSAPMVALFSMIESVAKTNSTVLVTGESGTGKELVARALHFNSLRRGQPFVAVNCGAIPDTLLESELFGHMRGAFTGADTMKKGLMEVADKGTIFLDEIGEMNPPMQVKLLRVLQERRFRRLGGTEELHADLRIVAATNQDLAKLVAEGRFREDLYYRINVIPVHLPPLRERRDDVALLADHFLAKHAKELGKPVRAIARDAMVLLEAYAWPGNVRELENVIERSVALERTEAVLAETLPLHLRTSLEMTNRVRPEGVVAGSSAVTAPTPPEIGDGFDLEARGEEFYRHYMALALERTGGVQARAAELLGMSFRSFRYYAKKLKLR
jgi:two-component system response regulator PilR (NtrC family)